MSEITLSTLLAAPWAALGLAHSFLGERYVLKPLFAHEGWSLRSMSRPAAVSLLRFAWHATTIAWLGLAVAAWGGPLPAALVGVALASGLLGLVALRWHLAWPIFLLGAGLTAWAENWLAPLLPAFVGSIILLAVALSALHVFWAFGGSRGLSTALPTLSSGEPLFRPGRWTTLAVAALLALFGVLLYGATFEDAGLARWGLAAGAVVLLVRAVGDGRYVGFTKTLRTTHFGRLDDRLYTPLVVFLFFGALGAIAS